MMQKKDFIAGTAQLLKHMIPIDVQGSKVFFLRWFTVNVNQLTGEIREKHDLYCYLFCTKSCGSLELCK